MNNQKYRQLTAALHRFLFLNIIHVVENGTQLFSKHFPGLSMLHYRYCRYCYWHIILYNIEYMTHQIPKLKANGNLSSNVTQNALDNLSIISEYFSLWSECMTNHKSALLSWHFWLVHCFMGAIITNASRDAYHVMWSHVHAANIVEHQENWEGVIKIWWKKVSSNIFILIDFYQFN